MATMKQIADLAGVSRGTVDRVLNNRGIVNEETARKVRRIAESLNYTPSIAARSLAAKKMNIKLLYIMPNPSHGPFFKRVGEAVEEKARELAEYGVTVETITYDIRNYNFLTDSLSQAVLSGISGAAIAAPPLAPFYLVYDALNHNKIPFVTINMDFNIPGRLAYVGSNSYQCGATGAGLVAAMAHPGSKIAVLDSIMQIDTYVNLRSKGFFETMRSNYPHIIIQDVISNCDDDYETYALTKAYLASHPDTDVLFINGAGVYGACRVVEALPPEKRPRLVCFDLTSQMEPMLKNGVITATICQQPAVQAAKPLDILFEYIALGKKPAQERFYTNTEIIIRENYF